MSGLVTHQGRVIRISTAHVEVAPLFSGISDGQEFLADTEGAIPHLGEIDDEQKYPSQIDESHARHKTCRATVAQTEDRDLWFYRDRTVALLKQYARMAVESGRLPSLLGRECFRTSVTPYALASFEDMAIFVHDMRAAMARLSEMQQKLITLNVLEEFSQWEIARLLGCTTRWIEWQLSDALDALTRVLVGRGLVRRMEAVKREEKTNRL